MAIITTENLTKKFGKFTALNGVNIEVAEGEIYGFIGPNGAGKSTTIRILLGMLKATSGKAQVFGKGAWKDAVDIHKRIAYVPGDVNLWPNLTGGEVIDLFLKMKGELNKAKRDEMIDLFQLDPAKKCRTYSKGNRQKVALVAALASDADLFIFDEPTSGLDPLMESIFQQCARDLANRGKTVFLSSHILSEVEKLCEKVAIIREGKIIEAGSLQDMRHLTRNKMTIRTKKPIPDLEKLKGVHQFVKEKDELVFQVDTDQMDEVIRYISPYGILKLESAPPTLEDLFLRHYRASDDTDEGRGRQ